MNYDIHRNSVCIVRRFGRVDRIGGKNACFKLVKFWSYMDLDDVSKNEKEMLNVASLKFIVK